MKKLVIFTTLLLGFSLAALAQDTPAVEIFGGYSYFRLNPTEEASHGINQNGWNASLAVNGNKWIGFVADFRGYYKNDDGADIRAHYFMFGPKIAVRQGKVTPFVQALLGAARTTATDSDTGEKYYASTDFAFSLGGGFDINVSHMVAIRPAQVEFVGLKNGVTGDLHKNFTYSAGVVFKLGKR